MNSFDELDLIDPLRRSLSENGYLIPTPIQAQTLPPAIEGHDVLGSAQTGTGKTAAFALPILNWVGKERINARPRSPVSLVLAPTRELAIQIGESFTSYGRYLPLKLALVYGGVGQRNQVRDLNRGPQVVVATPGRLLDLMAQGHVTLDDLEIFVLDEADRMLDMGFLPDLKRIMRQLPKDRQSLFFSATLPPSIQSLAQQLLWDPINVTVTPESQSVEKIDQQLMLVEKREKQALLKQILAAPGVDRAIVFTKTKRGANRLSEHLERGGFKSAAIHGNKSQSARQRALTAFRDQKVSILVATDVAARGIDIDGITHVVNYDLPNEPESYVHRIGRTGRAGAEGIAVSLCSPEERRELRAIEKLLGRKVPITRRPTAQAKQQASSNRSESKHSTHPRRRTSLRGCGTTRRRKQKPHR